MVEAMILEPHLQRLLTQEGFIEAFWEQCADYHTQKDAYEAVERQYERTFGMRKYSDWDSFRKVRDRLIKTRKQA